MVAGWDTDSAMKLEYTGAEMLGSLVHLSVRLPGILVLPALGGGIPRASAQAPVIGVVLDALFPDVIVRAYLWVHGCKQRLVLEAPVTIDG